VRIFPILLAYHTLTQSIAHRVNDLLRDKLHHQSSQLAETRDRVRELEEAEKGQLSEIVAILGGAGECGRREEGGGGGLGEIFPSVSVVIVC
jgi:hypothetical protein